MLFLFIIFTLVAVVVFNSVRESWKVSTGQSKFTKIIIFIVAVILAIVCLANYIADEVGSGGSSYSSSSKKGFVGSDGEYHSYIPEFGDDVNKWMEENW